jgi:hypothetical protein
MNAETLRAFAPDLDRTAPRSPRVALGQFPAVAGLLVDNRRAQLVGSGGSYHYNCPMDQKFFAATGLEANALRAYIATGANDAEVAARMSRNTPAPREKIAAWSRRFLANPLWRLLDLEDWLHVKRAARR